MTETTDQRLAWDKALLMSKLSSKLMRVCYKHFKASDDIFPSGILPNKMSTKQVSNRRKCY